MSSMEDDQTCISQVYVNTENISDKQKALKLEVVELANVKDEDYNDNGSIPRMENLRHNVEELRDPDMQRDKISTKTMVVAPLKRQTIKYVGEMVVSRWSQYNAFIKLCFLYSGIMGLAGVGAIIFNLCEKSNEQIHVDYTQALRREVDESGVFSDEELEWIHGEWYEVSNTYHESNVWEMKYAAFFACTTFTTIGYGFQAPQTFLGQLFTIIYGLPSILLFLLLAKESSAILLKWLNDGFSFMLGDFWRTYWPPIAFALMSLLVLGFCHVIHITASEEGFGTGIDSLGHAVYFLMQTTTTIGFGDVMMSGSSNMATGLLGLWICSLIGFGLNLAEYLTEELDIAMDMELEEKRKSHILNNSINENEA